MARKLDPRAKREVRRRRRRAIRKARADNVDFKSTNTAAADAQLPGGAIVNRALSALAFSTSKRVSSAFEGSSLQVILHAQSVLIPLGSFALRLLSDYALGRVEAMEQHRAADLRGSITKAGTAYIKLAQALSVRPDILPRAYVEELQKLQDTAPEFTKEEARDLIEDTLGCPIEDVFESETAFYRPIASASIGQVYKARLLSGEDVAVKVQRPGVYEAASLDIRLIKGFLSIASKTMIPILKDQAGSMIPVVESWAESFFQEVDYLGEAENMRLFEHNMRENAVVSDAIKIPRVYDEFTSSTVLVTEWVVGTKFSQIDFTEERNREQCKYMVTMLLNAYLVQLFETGMLHADPHPGNFLRLSDGRVAILDFGLTTTVSTEQQYQLFEFIANLIGDDFDACIENLSSLGFVPEAAIKNENRKQIVKQVISRLLSEMKSKGGILEMDFVELLNEFESLSSEYAIVLPPWFALVLRAFSTIEGLGLRCDPEYQLVDECFPYLAQRLLTDDSDRMRNILRKFFYANNGAAIQTEYLETMLNGFARFTSSFDRRKTVIGDTASDEEAAASSSQSTADSRPSPQSAANGAGMSSSMSAQLLRTMLSRKNTYVQELLVRELVRGTDAASRNAGAQMVRRIAGPVASAARPAASGALGTLPDGAMKTQLQVIVDLANIASDPQRVLLSDEDRESLAFVQKVQEALVRRQASSGGAAPPDPQWQGIARASSEFLPLLPELMPGLRNMAGMFASKMAGRQVHRLVSGVANLSEALASATNDADPSPSVDKNETARSVQSERPQPSAPSTESLEEKVQASTKAIESMQSRIEALERSSAMSKDDVSRELQSVRQQLQDVLSSVRNERDAETSNDSAQYDRSDVVASREIQEAAAELIREALSNMEMDAVSQVKPDDTANDQDAPEWQRQQDSTSAMKQHEGLKGNRVAETKERATDHEEGQAGAVSTNGMPSDNQKQGMPSGRDKRAQSSSSAAVVDLTQLAAKHNNGEQRLHKEQMQQQLMSLRKKLQQRQVQHSEHQQEPDQERSSAGAETLNYVAHEDDTVLESEDDEIMNMLVNVYQDS